MNDFLNIQTFFSNENERNISHLAGVYNNPELLKSTLTDLLFPVLSSSDLIKGKSVLLKPNWVKHPSNFDDEICLVTNSNFILAILEVIAEQGPRMIIVADAPIQSCSWDLLVTKELFDKMHKICQKCNVSLAVKDFRKVYFDPINNKKD